MQAPTQQHATDTPPPEPPPPGTDDIQPPNPRRRRINPTTDTDPAWDVSRPHQKAAKAATCKACNSTIAPKDYRARRAGHASRAPVYHLTCAGLCGAGPQNINNWNTLARDDRNSIRLQLDDTTPPAPDQVTLPTLDTPTIPPVTGPRNLDFWDTVPWEDITTRTPTIVNIPTTLHTNVAEVWHSIAQAINTAHDQQTPTTIQHRTRLWKLLLATPQMLFNANMKGPIGAPNTKPTPHATARQLAERIQLWHAGTWHLLQPTDEQTATTTSRTQQADDKKQKRRTVEKICNLLQDGEITRALQQVHRPQTIAEPDTVRTVLPTLFPQAKTTSGPTPPSQTTGRSLDSWKYARPSSTSYYTHHVKEAQDLPETGSSICNPSPVIHGH